MRVAFGFGPTFQFILLWIQIVAWRDSLSKKIHFHDKDRRKTSQNLEFPQRDPSLGHRPAILFTLHQSLLIHTSLLSFFLYKKCRHKSKPCPWLRLVALTHKKKSLDIWKQREPNNPEITLRKQTLSKYITFKTQVEENLGSGWFTVWIRESVSFPDNGKMQASIKAANL